MSDTVIVALISLLGTIITVVMVPLAVFLWRRWQASSKARGKEREAAKAYASEATAATEALERENDELQLELEAAHARESLRDERMQRLTNSYEMLAESYRRLADGKAVNS